MLLRRGCRALLVAAATAAVVVGPVVGPVVGLVVGPAGAAEGPECGAGTAGEVSGANTVYDELAVRAATAAAPGAALRSVRVVVVAPRTQESAGAIAEGIVAGPPTSTGQPVGIVPGVEVSVVGYGTSQEATTAQLAAALGTVRPAGHTIVVVQGTVKPSTELTRALRRLRGALVVAPIGDPPESSSDPVVGDLYSDSDAAPPQDAAGRVAPASDESVLAVGVAGWSSADTQPLLNSDVDVAAPVGGGLSYAPGACVVPGVRTDWAAAEVAGVAALTWAALPHQRVDQLRSRLELTADGGGDSQGNTVGYGVVQPLAAVTLSPRALKGGGPADPVQHRAAPPVQPADVLAGTRRTALWWGLIGGGALAVALLLRPLLSRRRSGS